MIKIGLTFFNCINTSMGNTESFDQRNIYRLSPSPIYDPFSGKFENPFTFLTHPNNVSQYWFSHLCQRNYRFPSISYSHPQWPKHQLRIIDAAPLSNCYAFVPCYSELFIRMLKENGFLVNYNIPYIFFCEKIVQQFAKPKTSRAKL